MKKYRPEKDCLNCGTTVADKFCPNCGQENLQTREPFWSFIFHNVGHYFHFESKFLKSFVPLVTKPGKLTNEFISGKRAAHFPPFSLYLIISLVFFLFVLKDNQSSENTPKTDLKSVNTQIDSLEKVLEVQKLNAVQKKLITQQIERFKADTASNQSSFTWNSSSDTIAFKNVAAYETHQQSLAPNKKDPWIKHYFIKKDLQITQKYRDRKLSVITEAIIHNIPKMMFILMPLFALILSLSFYKSKMYFMEHLVYTLHLHSFIFLLYSFVTIVSYLWQPISGLMYAAAIITTIWYIYRSMRTVYGRGRVHILIKLFILGFFYLILLCISLTSVMLFSVLSL